MKFYLLLFTLFSAAFLNLYSQLVNEWNVSAQISTTETQQALDNYGENYVAISSLKATVDSVNRVIFSSDGGKNWDVILADRYYNIDDDYNPLPGNWNKQIYQSVSMPVPDIIYLVVPQDLRDDNSEVYYPVIYKTHNKGKNWDTISICDRLQCYRNYISMIGPKTGFLLSGNCVENTELAQAIYYTEDGFETFKKFYLPVENDNNSIFNYFEALDKSTLIVGSNDLIMITTDNGNSWDFHTSPPNVTNYCFINKNHGFACSNIKTGHGTQKKGLIYETFNGGQNWNLTFEQKDGRAFDGFVAIDFLDENNGIVAGRMQIYCTTDGGKNWEMQQIPYQVYQEPLLYVNYGSKSSAVITGAKYAIYTHWNRILKSPNLSVNGIQPKDLNYELNWTAIEGAKNYKVQLAEYEVVSYPTYNPENFEAHIILEIDETTELKQSLMNKLNYNKDYYSRVKAYGDTVNSSWSRYTHFRTDKEQQPGVLTKPKLLFPEFNNEKMPPDIEFIWRNVPAAVKYQLSVKKELISKNPEYDRIINDIKDTTYLVTNLKEEMKYYWFVTAFDSAGNYVSSNYRIFTTRIANGVTGRNSDGKFEVYPVPAENTIKIALKKRNNLHQIVIIIDTKGRTVHKSVIYGEVLELDISSYTGGVYFVRIVDGDNILDGKFVK